MLSFHSGDVDQTARPRERENSNIRTLGRVLKVKSHSLGYECLIKIPNPARPSPRDNIDRCIITSNSAMIFFKNSSIRPALPGQPFCTKVKIKKKLKTSRATLMISGPNEL